MASHKEIIVAGDLVQLMAKGTKSKILRVEKGSTHQSKDGIVEHDHIIGLKWGAVVESHLGKRFMCLQPAFDDLLRSVNRKTQTLYPKDMAYIILSMGIGPGDEVLEIGTGSGSMSIALAHAVGKEGRVISYERRPEIQNIAIENAQKLGFDSQISFILKDIGDGIDENNQSTVFVDMADPENYLDQISSALHAGAFFACLLPTTNQISRLILAMKKAGFSLFEVSEILHRYYKPVARRLRPADNMVAHTGYLLFARYVREDETMVDKE